MNARIGENMPVNNSEALENNTESQEDNTETNNENNAESIKSKVDAAHQELTEAHQILSRVEGQQSKIAGVREKLGISTEQDGSIKEDIESARQRVDEARGGLRGAMGDYGRSLVQEQLLDSDTVLTNEEVLNFLYTEKAVGIDEVDDQGNSTARTLAQEYEARLNSAQESSQEKTPVQKNIASKLWEGYNNIPKKHKAIMGATLAAGIGAMSGGTSAALMAGGNKLTKMIFSAGAAAGADALLQKQLHKRDVKKQMTDDDFAQRAEGVAEESFAEAKASESSVEEGILMGAEKKMAVFNEMFTHQKSKNKIRMATSVLVGVSIGSGMFDATDVQAASGIKSGSFNFGGGGMQSGGLATENIQAPSSVENPVASAVEISDDDGWDVDTKNTMSAGLQREAGVIPNADGKTMETDISRFSNDRESDIPVDEHIEITSGNEVEPGDIVSAADNNVEPGDIVSASESVQETVTEPIQNSSEINTVESSDFFAQFTKAEAFALERVDAGSVIIQAGTEDSILNRIKLQAGLPEQGESMADYLTRYASGSTDELTYSQKKHILSFV